MAKYGVPVNLDREGRKVHEEYHKDLEVNAKMALDVIDEVKDAGDYATAEGDRAKEFSDNIESVMKDGPVQTVNGKTGQVTGLAEQAELDETNSRLADTVLGINDNVITPIYDDNGNLIRVEEKKDGIVVKSVDLNFNDDLLKEVIETINEDSVKSTLNYTNGNLTSIEKEVI